MKSVPDTDDVHPIDVVEVLAEHHAWEFDRVTEDQIAMAIEGRWRTYSLTVAYSHDSTVRLICTFEVQPIEGRRAAVFEVVNCVNDTQWLGAFTFWEAQNLMVYRSAIALVEYQVLSSEQLDEMIARAVAVCEQFYPAIQMTAVEDISPQEAMHTALNQAYGRA